MKAVVFEQNGGVEVLQYKDVPEPRVGPDDVLIRVRGAACNYNDIWARRGMPGMTVILPHISGSDVAGEVVEVGSEVSHVKPGDEVVVHCGVSCRMCEFCANGEDFFCKEFKIWGFQTGPLDGGHAEYVSVPGYNVVPKPEGLTWVEAASLPLVLVTAWRMLVTRARIQPGAFVLIWGAAGGLGTMAIQICKVFGANAIAVAHTDDRLEYCRKLGAEYLINRTKQDVLAEVRRITGHRGADVVFEHVGNATWEQSVHSLKWGGVLVTCGATTGFEAVTDIRYLWNKQMNFLGSHLGNKSELLLALRFVESGQIKPAVSQVFPLSETAHAQTLMETAAEVGKLVLVPDS